MELGEIEHLCLVLELAVVLAVGPGEGRQRAELLFWQTAKVEPPRFVLARLDLLDPLCRHSRQEVARRHAELCKQPDHRNHLQPHVAGADAPPAARSLTAELVRIEVRPQPYDLVLEAVNVLHERRPDVVPAPQRGELEATPTTRLGSAQAAHDVVAVVSNGRVEGELCTDVVPAAGGAHAHHGCEHIRVPEVCRQGERIAAHFKAKYWQP